jgi:hypothetical protein
MNGTLGAVLLAQAGGEGGGGFFGTLITLIELALVVLAIVGLWKVFEKAHKPGWAAIIPIYNIYVLLEIVGRPWWWLILFIIPCVNFVIAIIVGIDLAKCFGKDTLYGIGLGLLGFIFFPLLGFSDAQYRGPVAKS